LLEEKFGSRGQRIGLKKAWRGLNGSCEVGERLVGLSEAQMRCRPLPIVYGLN
jgi:hypothetical protein